MRGDIKWTNLSRRQIAERMGALGTPVSRDVVSQLRGLTVTVTMLEKVYETGRKCAEGFKESMTIAFDKVLPKWNYRAIPSKS